MTKVINLFGGSGLGKSTLAAGLFYEMKMRGMNVEMVREYVKQWAWEGKKVGPFDQPYLFGKQVKYESGLYGKVDFLVTDSPLLLSPIYELHYTGDSIIEPAAHKFIKFAEANEVQYYNFLLVRNKPFDTRGRYETEDQAKAVDATVKQKLSEWGYKVTEVGCEDRSRVEFILSQLES